MPLTADPTLGAGVIAAKPEIASLAIRGTDRGRRTTGKLRERWPRRRRVPAEVRLLSTGPRASIPQFTINCSRQRICREDPAWHLGFDPGTREKSV